MAHPPVPDARPTVRAAVVQAAPVLFDREATLERVGRLTGEAAAAGAQLVVFPEAFVSAYPRGLDFGAVVGSRSRAGREAFRRYWASSVDVPGPAVDALAEVARAHGVHVVIGVVERDGGTLYCTVLFFSDEGRYLGKHRKLMPTGSERLVWGFGDGSTLTVLDTPLGRLGAVICWENYMPLLRAAMYHRGVELYCAPTADMRDSWIASMRHIAVEGRCFVLSCNQFVTVGDYPEGLRPAGEPDEVVCSGGSCIVDPFGTLLAGPARDGETVLVADLDLDEGVRGKYDLDSVGHYARPDVFRLLVNEAATPLVLRSSAPPHDLDELPTPDLDEA